MRVIHKLGPADHGRPIEYDEFLAAEYEPGFHYEIIDGRLYVSPGANPPQDRLDTWLFGKMFLYSQLHPESINYVTSKARVFVPGRSGVTAPEPDLAAYRDYPLELPFEELDWEKLRPIIVGEVISPGDPKKDLVRNVELYLQVLSIKEYWVLDGRENYDRPTMHVFRKRGNKWTKIEVAFGETYTTKLLPGFALKIDPRS
jgi:Uma2 family endonuclease